ncbi:ABC transporter [Desulfonema ishimotonii]|uniref:ABC transporter n=1 Tax=Desulfonema ishimotonii TaxID=45657 RepID=A0A401FVE5_9BACT|nr:ABC transporter ATP-binding protein [Desulfonema ishimotonii]GBC60942.1 ABC transporter [Desulfonema ishimotonii]
MKSQNIAVRVEELSKLYRIGVKEEMHENFAGAIVDFIRSPFKNYRKYRSLYRFDDVNIDTGIPESDDAVSDIIWALRNVSFEVRRGEVLGIIGRNGAGKSTLLKVLSRITDPTRGRVEIRGRVSSLLEVGTGFHQELTGRENVYLNGTILGMTKKEIDRKFDEIVAFSGIERFIDTPVKRYSSGMKIRLAFSVASHLEPEILIVDEVLAVGDAEFQKKCLNTMQDVGQQGRTVLFVSHNMPAITRMCERAILMEEGQVFEIGPAYRVVNSYLNSGQVSHSVREWPDPGKAPRGDVVCLRAIRVRGADGQITDVADIRRPVQVEMEYEVRRAGRILFPRLIFTNEESFVLFTANDLDPAWRGQPRPKGVYRSVVTIPGNFLAEGRIFVTAHLACLKPLAKQFWARDAVAFQVVDSMEGDSARGEWAHQMDGVVRPLLQWTTHPRPAG